MEVAFRRGAIKVVVCTQTLATGINMPCRYNFALCAWHSSMDQIPDSVKSECRQQRSLIIPRSVVLAGQAAWLTPLQYQQSAVRLKFTIYYYCLLRTMLICVLLLCTALCCNTTVPAVTH